MQKTSKKNNENWNGIYVLPFIWFILFQFPDFVVQVKVTYSKKVIGKYNRAIEALPEKYKKYIQENSDRSQSRRGFVIIEILMDDTLNLNDLEPIDTTLKIMDLDSAVVKVDTAVYDEIPIMFAFGFLNSDTLNIKITPGLMSSQAIQHTVIKNKIYSAYNEYFKRDSILKTNNSTMATNDMLIPARTIKFILSDKNISHGNVLYGEAEIITEDFYYLAAYRFKNNTLRHRLHFRYLFKLNVE